MKGLELNVILGIIFLIVLLVLVVSAFINPVQGQGNATFNQEEFRRYCTWWATTDYKGTSATLSDGTPQNMSVLCSQALQLNYILSDSNAGDPNWERCKATCRISYPKA